VFDDSVLGRGSSARAVNIVAMDGITHKIVHRYFWELFELLVVFLVQSTNTMQGIKLEGPSGNPWGKFGGKAVGKSVGKSVGGLCMSHSFLFY